MNDATSLKYVEDYRCAVCGCENNKELNEVFDDRYGFPKIFKIVKCSSCGHLSTFPQIDQDSLSILYARYYPRESISVAQVLDEFKHNKKPFIRVRRWLNGTDNQGQLYGKAGENFLDIGCGYGISLLEAREYGMEAFGVEADPNVKKFAEELNLKIFNGSIQETPFPNVKFDIIVLNQVIEHMPEPDKTLEILKERLSINGRIILVFPNINSIYSLLTKSKWINWHIPYHLHHFSLKTFVKMASRVGYNVKWSRTITPTIWTIMQIRALKGTVQSGVPNPLWKVNTIDSSERNHTDYKKINLKRVLLPVVFLVFGILNRIVDILGLGDSLIVELVPKRK